MKVRYTGVFGKHQKAEVSLHYFRGGTLYD